MSNELHINAASGKTIYIVRFNEAGEVARSDGTVFENWGTSGHDADDYDVSASEVGSSGHYVADFDSSNNIAGVRKYFWRAHDQAGANKSTGAIDYYDDDGQTVILTHTPTDVESSITRTPS